jgi:multiple sugar transport system permease protein
MPEPTKRSHPLAGALWSLLAIGFTLLFVFPLYWAVSTALRNPADTFTVAGIGFPWLDFQPTLDNFRTELSTPEGLRALRTSIIVSVTAVFAALALGLPAAYALARFRFFVWKNADITIWFLSQRVLPPVATLLPFYIIFRSFGLLDTKLALILINATFILPFVVVILRQTFLDLPVELEEAALVDGCSRVQALRRVVLPLARPGLLAVALFTLTNAWNEFLFAFVFITKDEYKTLPVGMQSMIAGDVVPQGQLAAASLLVSIPVVIMYAFGQRFLTEGLTAGAVKG